MIQILKEKKKTKLEKQFARHNRKRWRWVKRLRCSPPFYFNRDTPVEQGTTMPYSCQDQREKKTKTKAKKKKKKKRMARFWGPWREKPRKNKFTSEKRGLKLSFLFSNLILQFNSVSSNTENACSYQWHEKLDADEEERIGGSGTGSTILFSAIILKRSRTAVVEQVPGKIVLPDSFERGIVIKVIWIWGN